MIYTPKRIISGSQLTASAATYATAAVGTRLVIKSMILCNTTATPVVCTVYLIPSGGTAGATNTVMSTQTVAAYQTVTVHGAIGQVLEAGGFIQALGLNATIMASGIEVT